MKVKVLKRFFSKRLNKVCYRNELLEGEIGWCKKLIEKGLVTICTKKDIAEVENLDVPVKVNKEVSIIHDVTQFKDIHKGDRCFIIATGPSLNYSNLEPLKNEICFGVNTLIQSMHRLGLKCKYYCISDPIEWRRQTKESLAQIKSGSILFGRQNGANVVLTMIGTRVLDGNFNSDLTKPIHPGGTVVISMVLPIVDYMGFKEIYLVGCDCDKPLGELSHVEKKMPYEKEARELMRRDHNNPIFTNNWTNIFKSYEMCKSIFEEKGKKIINCTVGGKLEVFERKTIEEVCKTDRINRTKFIGYYTLRLNSKRIPHKNVRILNNRYLLNYSLETLNKVPILEDIIVYSKDDLSQYIEKGLRYTWKERPSKFDEDESTFNDILDSIINELDTDYIVFLTSTSPFIKSSTVIDMINKIKSGEYDSAFTVMKHNRFAWYKEKPLNHTIKHIERSQDIEPVFIENGLFIFSKKLYLKTGRRIGYNPYIKEVGLTEGWDLDTEEEWDIAEKMCQ